MAAPQRLLAARRSPIAWAGSRTAAFLVDLRTVARREIGAIASDVRRELEAAERGRRVWMIDGALTVAWQARRPEEVRAIHDLVAKPLAIRGAEPLA